MKTTRWMSWAAMVVLVSGCSAKSTEGENAGSDDVKLEGDTSACEGLPMSAIGCAEGEAVASCDVSSGKAAWKISCNDVSEDLASLEGKWGGQGIELTIDAKANGAILYDCGGGGFEGITRDTKGDFSLVGTHTRGVPILQPGEEEPQPKPAKYWGNVKGKTMTLYVQTELSPDTSVFTLTFGTDAVLHTCQ